MLRRGERGRRQHAGDGFIYVARAGKAGVSCDVVRVTWMRGVLGWEIWGVSGGGGRWGNVKSLLMGMAMMFVTVGEGC